MKHVQLTDKVLKFRQVWKELASTTVFGGMTLDDFKAVTKTSFDERDTVAMLEILLAAAIGRRSAADKASRDRLQVVANAVRADPAFGPDSALYRALGYTPKSERRSGLTRKVKTTATTPASGTNPA